MPNIDIPIGDKKIAQLLASPDSETSVAAKTLIEFTVTPEVVESALPSRLSDESLSAMILDEIANGGLTAKTTEPADADVNTGEAALWFDSTNGAPKLMIKAKQADGSVMTGWVVLS